MNKKIKILLFFTLYTLLTLYTQHLYSQWTQLPNLPVSGTVWDMYFVNSSTGWVTLVSPTNIIKTTDGGISWVVQANISIRNIQFLDENTGYGQGFIGTNGTIWKTINGGINWNSILSDGNGYADIAFVNQDTGWVCGFDGFLGGVWRTTNGGSNWIRQYTSASNGLDKIFFLKNKVNGEYWGWTFKTTILFKTTNSGTNWFEIPGGISGGDGNGIDMYFTDTSRGIVVRSVNCISKTMNGGYNWNSINIFNVGTLSRLAIANDNVGWITILDSVIKTVDFFQTFGRQPHPLFVPGEIFVYDTSYAWAGKSGFSRTTNGGGPIIYLGIDTNNIIVPTDFTLYQNYPNPFNPQTTIKFSIIKTAAVSLTVYDITGKEIIKIYNNENLIAGNYKAIIDFEKINISSGVYFYELKISDNNNSNLLYTKSLKMVYLK
jgi:photosystem II stability/assembly factor-like uncharacterized protein